MGIPILSRFTEGPKPLSRFDGVLVLSFEVDQDRDFETFFVSVLVIVDIASTVKYGKSMPVVNRVVVLDRLADYGTSRLLAPAPRGHNIYYVYIRDQIGHGLK